MTLKAMLEEGAAALCAIDDSDAVSDAKLFAMHLFGVGYSDLFMKMNDDVDDELLEKYRCFIKRRCEHEPTQYIIGSTCFMGYDFFVEPGVLIPRFDTELLVEKAYALSKDKVDVKALDMCAGSGCIGISYRLCRGKNHLKTTVTLADISDAAIELCVKNNVRHAAECRIIKTDLFEKIDEKYDIILSNPPYIRTADIEGLKEEVRVFEPLLALDGAEDGLLFYRRIIKACRNYLADDGIIVFEIGYDQYDAVSNLLSAEGFKDIELTRDYAGLCRIVSARLLEKG